MPSIRPEIEVSPVHHLPILKAYADQLGLVSLIKHYVPTEMHVEAGPVVLGLVWDTLRGRSPLYRLDEFFAQPDTALLLGQAVPPQALHDATAGVSSIASTTLAPGGSSRPVRSGRPCGLAWSAAMSTVIRPRAVSGATISVPRHRPSPFR
jgi:hypothetical protein